MAATVALCVTCKGRRAHVAETLPKNLAHNAGYEALKVLLLDYDSDDGLAEWVARTRARDLAEGRLIYYRSPDHPTFKMGHAKNMAHRLALREGADILVNVDADNYTGAGFARAVAGAFETAEQDGEAIFLRPRDNHFGPGQRATRRMPWGCGGRIALTREAFLASGGYDEGYEHWGPDDKDLAARLTKLGYVRHGFGLRHLRSIQHGDEVRFANYEGGPKDIWAAAEKFKLTGREELTVANHGQIGLGLAHRNFDCDPVAIEPLPTRVFGIGFHKTATTSLSEALCRLGYASAHWVSPTWAHAVLEQVRTSGRSSVLDCHYSACDLPIGLIYRELDKLYPGSKFILTIRNEEEWLRSVAEHFGRFSGEWDVEGFSHYVHREAYGRTSFDADTFLTRYRRHNAEVRAYFANRPDDLLVMDMSAGAGWPELCSFLHTSTPIEDYPMAFVTPQSMMGPPAYFE